MRMELLLRLVNGFALLCSSTDRSVLEFKAIEIQANKFVSSQFTKFMVICYSSNRKLIQTGHRTVYPKEIKTKQNILRAPID